MVDETVPVAADGSDGAVVEWAPVAGAVPSAADPDALERKDLPRAQHRVAKACVPERTKALLADFGIELRTVTAKLSFDSISQKLVMDIGRSGLQIEADDAKARVELEARKRVELLLGRGPRTLFAEAIRVDPKMISSLLQQMSTLEQERYQNEIGLLHKFLAEGHIEGHHLPADVRDEFLRNLMNRASLGDILRLGAAAESAPAKIEETSAKS